MTQGQQGIARWRPTFYAIGGTLLLLGGFVLAVPNGAPHTSPVRPDNAPPTDHATRSLPRAPTARAALPEATLSASPTPPTVSITTASATSAAPPVAPKLVVSRSVEELRQLTNEDDLPQVAYVADPRLLVEPDEPESATRVHDEADPRLSDDAEPEIRRLTYEEQRRLNDQP